MKRYKEYKDINLSWFNEVPTQWEVKKFNSAIKLLHGFQFRDSHFKEDGVKIVKITQLKADGTLDLTEASFVEKKYLTILNDKIIKNGDILMALTGGTIGKIILVANLEEQVLQNYRVGKFIPKDKKELDKGFMFWILRSELTIAQILYLLRETGQPNIGISDFSKMFFPIPNTLDEQRSIVKFLDHKTERIDRFIANRKKQIDLFKEQLHFKINEAITKGINQKVKFKPTDIKYVPEIPEHWDIRKFKGLTSILTCGVAATPEYVEESEGVAFLSAQNCRPFTMDLSKYSYIKPELHKQLTKYKKPQKGDVLVTRVGAGIGQACIIDSDLEFSVYVSLTHIRPNQEILSEYIVYFFNTEYCYQLNHEGTVVAGGQGNLNVKNVERYRIPLPPIDEQKEIIAYLDNYRIEMNFLITKYQKQIDLMQEYRTALISQAVTGKIDVRDWQAKEKTYKETDIPVAMAAEQSKQYE